MRKTPPPSGESSIKVTTSRLVSIYNKLLEHFGHRNWWPGDTPFEVMVGAILTQNTAWTNVEKAMANLRARNLLEPKALAAARKDTIARLIRPSGYYNQKAIKLKSFTRYFKNYGYSIETMKKAPMETLREELLEVKGIGPETADSMLLYALDKPIFVIDAYTIRSFSRIGMISGQASYSDVQELFMKNLEPDLGLYNDYHAQIVALGHNYCKKNPLCKPCPLYIKTCKWKA